MKHLSIRWISCLALVLFLAPPAAIAAQEFNCSEPPHKLLTLRHARRMDDSQDAPLSARGWEEAGRLVGVLADEPISRIYVSTKRRTQQTAIPLSEYLEIEPIAIEDTPEGTERLLTALCRSRRNDVIVYIGHTYTLEQIFTAFGVQAEVGGAESVHEIAFRPRGPKHRLLE